MFLLNNIANKLNNIVMTSAKQIYYLKNYVKKKERKIRIGP
jgi:hypothetical protein